MQNLNYSGANGSLKELDFSHVSSTSNDEFISRITELVTQTILPRKITVNGTTETFELFLYKRAIAGFRVSKSAKCTWINEALTPRVQTILYEFLLSACEALENGSLSISLLSDNEKSSLREASVMREVFDSVDVGLEPSGVREVAPIVQTTESKTAPEVAAPASEHKAQQELMISNFYNEIKDVAIFTHFRDSATADVRTSGTALSADGTMCEAMSTEICGWERLVGPSLADGPKMIVASGPSGPGSVLVCAVQDTQYLVAEINLQKLGSVIALWNKTTQKV